MPLQQLQSTIPNNKLENSPNNPANVVQNIIPRKILSPVFIVEEDVRPLDLTTNLDSLIIKDLSNLTDMNLQHPELIPLIMMAEPVLKENEWFEIKGLMSRSSNSGNGSHHYNTRSGIFCAISRNFCSQN